MWTLEVKTLARGDDEDISMAFPLAECTFRDWVINTGVKGGFGECGIIGSILSLHDTFVENVRSSCPKGVLLALDVE